MSNFTFEHDGQTYEFEKPLDVVRSPRWLRANRRREETDFLFTIIETCGGDAVLEAVDAMDEDAFADLIRELLAALGTRSVGESGKSST